MLTAKAGLLPRPVFSSSLSRIYLLGKAWDIAYSLQPHRAFTGKCTVYTAGPTKNESAQSLPADIAKDRDLGQSSNGDKTKISHASKNEGGDKRLARNQGVRWPGPTRKPRIRYEINKEGNSNLDSWREHLRTAEQLEYESDLASSATPERGVRLIDNETLRTNIELWEILLQFRARAHGPESVAPIWARLKSVQGLDAAYILSSKIVVQRLIEAGYNSQNILNDFCKYIWENRAVTKDTSGVEDSIYTAVLSHALQKFPSRALLYHSMLRHLGPSKNQLCELVLYIAHHSRSSHDVVSREVLQVLSLDLPTFSEMYDLIITKLCAEGYHEDAIAWHSFLHKNGDLPRRADSITAIIPYLSQEELQEIVAPEMAENNRGFTLHTRNVKAPTQITKPEYRAHDLGLMPPLNKAPLSKASDELCTRLLATRFFPLETIINGLGLLRVTNIGPQSLREILLRTVDNGNCDVKQIRTSLEQLDTLGITTGRSVFARLVYKLVADADSEMLHDVAICDQQPDELENKDLQERFLSIYEARGDSREFNRTMAVLLVNTPEGARETKLWNYQLRSALNQANKELVTQRLEQMRYRNIAVNHQSRARIFAKLLSERLPDSDGKVGLPRDQNIEQYISLMKYILKGGNNVQPTEWDDILRTLLFRGKLKDFEELMFFLLNWYSDSRFRSTHFSTTSWVKGRSSNQYLASWQSLLRRSRVHEIVQLGFYHGSLPLQTSPLAGKDPIFRASKLTEHPTLWGVRFLAKLKDSGFAVDRRIVKQACIYRMWAMFSIGLHHKAINRTIRNGQVGSARDYIAAMEEIWGVGLFRRTVGIDDYAAQLVYLANRKSYLRWRAILRLMDRNGWKVFYNKSTKRDQRIAVFYKNRLLSGSSKLEAAGMMLKPDPELFVEARKFLEMAGKPRRVY